jgi:hypothetical protein
VPVIGTVSTITPVRAITGVSIAGAATKDI